jgi:hypothetical protein
MWYVNQTRRRVGFLTMTVTIYGICALSFMMVMYAMEERGRHFIAAFAVGCVLSGVYGFLAHAWPFGVVEFIWSAIAFRRYLVAGESS